MFDFKFDWQPQMDTQIEDMDTQHRQLFKIGRDMEQLLRIKCIGVTDAQLLDIILQLRDFTGYHFYEEEMLMEQIGYPKLKEHRQMHLKYATYVMNINLPKLKNNPERELKLIKDEVQSWIFTHMLHDDKEFAKAYLDFQKQQMIEQEKAKEQDNPVYIDGFGYKVCDLEVSNVYLSRDQRQKGEVLVSYKEKARDFNRLTALERNIYFGELSKVANALMKLYGTKMADYASHAAADNNFGFFIIPRYSKEDGLGIKYFDPAQEVVLEEDELMQRIKEIRKALNK